MADPKNPAVEAANTAEAPVRKRRTVNRGPRVTHIIAYVEDGKPVIAGLFSPSQGIDMLKVYDELTHGGKNPVRLQHTAAKD